MICEVAIATLGACFVSSLAFAKWAVDRFGKPGELRVEWVRLDYAGDVKCPKWASWCLKSLGALGPFCQCEKANRGHFHVTCSRCKWSGLSRTVNGK